MKKWNRVCSCILVIAMAAALGVCGQEANEKKSETGKDEVITVYKGRYMESIINALEKNHQALEQKDFTTAVNEQYGDEYDKTVLVAIHRDGSFSIVSEERKRISIN